MNNIFHILRWDAQRNLNLLRKPVDKGMTQENEKEISRARDNFAIDASTRIAGLDENSGSAASDF